jgi:hypothetical protein
MRLQTERQTIYQLYVQGGRKLPFMVIHHGLLHWHRDVIVSIHRHLRFGSIDKVLMYHCSEHNAQWNDGYDKVDLDTSFDELSNAINKSRLTNKLGKPTPVICQHWDEAVWYRVGLGWRVAPVLTSSGEMLY